MRRRQAFCNNFDAAQAHHRRSQKSIFFAVVLATHSVYPSTNLLEVAPDRSNNLLCATVFLQQHILKKPHAQVIKRSKECYKSNHSAYVPY
jgi:hypothetical protein